MVTPNWIQKLSNLLHRYHQKKKKIIVFGALGTFTVIFIMANFNFRADCLGEPRKNIVLLKTHKCASTTVQNIILRYGAKHNLTFALPTAANYFGHPKYFNRIFVPDVLSRQFNVMTHHTRFHYEELSLMMPSDTVFVTIVREPASLFESLYSYYLLEDYYKMNLETILKNESTAFKIMSEKRYYGRMGLNQMAFDLGLEPKDFLNHETVHRFCRILDSQFDMVMVAERMTESLILLMDLMRWTLDDIVFLNRNVRKSKLKSKLSLEAQDHLRKVNLADQIIYEHFMRRFDERIAQYGTSRMKNMVQKLTTKNSEVYEACVSEVVDNSIESFKNKSQYGYRDRYMLHYKLKNNEDPLCSSLLRSELEFTDILRKRQSAKN